MTGFSNTRHGIEEPVTVERAGPGGMPEKVTTHPAFAQIGASRVSGQAHLYDSDFRHNHFMTISIRRSELHRNISRDWHFGREEIIQVAMTEAQWATFVSAPNMGSGVPCTLQHLHREAVPELPPPPSRTAQFGAEMRKTTGAALAALKELWEEIDAMGLPKAKAAALKSKVEHANMQLKSNVPFVADQFDEHMEGTVERAKAEVHGYMTAVVQRAGLDALAGAAPLALEDHGGGK